MFFIVKPTRRNLENMEFIYSMNMKGLKMTVGEKQYRYFVKGVAVHVDPIDK